MRLPEFATLILLAVATILVRTLEALDMSYPPAEEGLRDVVVE